jgi:hypothetical protein
MMALLSVIGVAGAASDPDAWMALPILGFTGAALGVIMLILSLPGIIAGIGLLNFRPWARILTIVLSALNLMNFPFGNDPRRVRPLGHAFRRRVAAVRTAAGPDVAPAFRPARRIIWAHSVGEMCCAVDATSPRS